MYIHVYIFNILVWAFTIDRLNFFFSLLSDIFNKNKIMHDSHVNLPIVNRLLIYTLSFHSFNLPEKFNSQMKYIVYFILCIHVIIMMLYVSIYL